MLHIPGFYEVHGEPHWRAIDFISDLHLRPEDPHTFAAWAHHMAHTSADAVFILGDLFEAWVGDDAVGQPFEAECAEVLASAAERLQLSFMCGNRDFLVGRQLLDRAGVRGLQDPSRLTAWGHTVLLTHGDALCLDDTAYQAFRRQVRGEAWQREFLAQPLAQRLSLAQHMRQASREHQGQQGMDTLSDIDIPTAVAWMHQAGCRTLVHGHTHRPGTEVLAPGHTREVLSDWDVQARPPRASVLRLQRDGFHRFDVALA